MWSIPPVTGSMSSTCQGRKINSFGKQGTGDGELQLSDPYCDRCRRRCLYHGFDELSRRRFSIKHGKFLSKFGGTGTSIHDFIKPKGIAVDSEGHIWVSDSMRNSIQVFNREGKLLLIFGRLGIGPGEFNLPAGLFIDSKDRLYVADSYNYRVQVFQYLSDGKR